MNGTIICEYNVDDSALIIFLGINRKRDKGGTKRRIFDQSEVRREQLLRLKTWGIASDLYSTQRTAMSERIQLYTV